MSGGFTVSWFGHDFISSFFMGRFVGNIGEKRGQATFPDNDQVRGFSASRWPAETVGQARCKSAGSPFGLSGSDS